MLTRRATEAGSRRRRRQAETGRDNRAAAAVHDVAVVLQAL